MAKPGGTTDRGYGSTHQKERARLTPTVNAGQAYCTELTCLMPTRWIKPGTHWDLAHDRTRPGHYLGPAHTKCNRAEGGRYARARDRVRVMARRSRIW